MLRHERQALSRRHREQQSIIHVADMLVEGRPGMALNGARGLCGNDERGIARIVEEIMYRRRNDRPKSSYHR